MARIADVHTHLQRGRGREQVLKPGPRLLVFETLLQRLALLPVEQAGVLRCNYPAQVALAKAAHPPVGGFGDELLVGGLDGIQARHAQQVLGIPTRHRQLFSDLTYQSQRGRTLERIGKVTMSVPWGRTQEVAAELLPRLREEFGAHGLDLTVLTQWLWGTLAHMRRRGGVMHPEMASYAGDGQVWQLAKGAGRREWMPSMGDYTPHPVFLTLGKQSSFDKLSGNNRPTWYDRWAAAALGQQILLAKGIAPDLYAAAFEVLLKDGILLRTAHHQGDTLALNPDALEVDTEVAFISTTGSKRRLPQHALSHLARQARGGGQLVLLQQLDRPVVLPAHVRRQELGHKSLRRHVQHRAPGIEALSGTGQELGPRHTRRAQLVKHMSPGRAHVVLPGEALGGTVINQGL